MVVCIVIFNYRKFFIICVKCLLKFYFIKYVKLGNVVLILFGY